MTHTVWLLDAASAFNELTMLDRAGIHEVGLVAARAPKTRHSGRSSGATTATPRTVDGLTHLAQGTNVDIEGQGEILRITALPTPGERRLTLEPDGLLSNVDFLRVPRPYTITRTGYRPGLVALTFDDGPDSALDSAGPRHPEGKARAGDILHCRRECADRTRTASAHDPRGA